MLALDWARSTHDITEASFPAGLHLEGTQEGLSRLRLPLFLSLAVVQWLTCSSLCVARLSRRQLLSKGLGAHMLIRVLGTPWLLFERGALDFIIRMYHLSRNDVLK